MASSSAVDAMVAGDAAVPSGTSKGHWQLPGYDRSVFCGLGGLSDHRTIARLVVCDLETQEFMDGYECRFVVGRNGDLGSPGGVL